MNFTVVWLPAALDELTVIWTESTERNAVTAASNRLDQALAANPTEVGESREKDERLAFESPLQVYFRVFAQQRRVEVLTIGRARRTN